MIKGEFVKDGNVTDGILTLSSDAPTRRWEGEKVMFLEKGWGWGAGYSRRQDEVIRAVAGDGSGGGRAWVQPALWSSCGLGQGVGVEVETSCSLRRKENLCTGRGRKHAFFRDLQPFCPWKVPGIALKYGNCSHWSHFRSLLPSRRV